MEQRWPDLSPRGRELFRRGAEIALTPHEEWIDELNTAVLGRGRMSQVADDPALADALRRSNLAVLLHWASANFQRPGRRVAPNTGPESLEIARDLVRRGLDEHALDTYRIGQSVAWRRWMEICFSLTSDPDELRELLEASALSISAFVDDTVAAVSALVEAERDELTHGSNAERREAVGLILEGAPLSPSRAERKLGYKLTGPHVALVLWNGTGGDTARLTAVAEAVVARSGAPYRLMVVASTSALWVWMPLERAPHTGALERAVAPYPDVLVALGRPGTGVGGFRRSHLEAATAQRTMSRLSCPRRVARYEEVRLVSLLTSDPADADAFLADTLGDLRTAPAELRETVLAHVLERFNTSRTAKRLYTHRNTVIRRLARADVLLPQPLAENVVHVAAALELMRWRDAPSGA
ncbi:PucR family transcriptional regulator [Nocardiopsis sp. HNM0947]|uniref:PucR family transcriptional regulator n=1 Tax=Nocardiopsis coralli TaxID=2772213 RepID=A0ABR9PEG6_9ACTN|nr:helix-turn-helix domain-containing protein [Nocardiopsis coralli]MBE3002120.1 PucR family transcriptional regulator [Nocardiopsis coralli]